jgi:hypothetical protein
MRLLLMFVGMLGAAALGGLAARALAPEADAFLPHGAASRAAPAETRAGGSAPMLMAVRQFGRRPPAYVLGTDSAPSGSPNLNESAPPPDLTETAPPPTLDEGPASPPPMLDDEIDPNR